MKYRFITAIHFLRLEKEDTTLKLKQGCISNCREVLKETFGNDLSVGTLGVHSIDEISESVYYYVDGSFPDGMSQSDIDSFGTKLAFAFLRVIQLYLADLWEIRDNSVYVRDGFLYSYTDNIYDGCTFKASMSAVNSKANGMIEDVTFSDAEIMSLADDMRVLTEEEIKGMFSMDYKKATQEYILKSTNLSRKELAYAYVRMARAAALVPIKLMFYSIALEALVGTANTELSHRMAERVTSLLGDDTSADKVKMYNNIKKAYDIRSKVAHGDFLKSDEGLVERSVFVDECLRKLLKLDAPYNLTKDKIDEFFIEKLFRS